MVGPLDVPDDGARPRVERDDVRVDGRQVDLVVVDGEVAGSDDAAELVRGVLVPVAPQELAGGGVERLHDAERAGDVQDAVVDEGVRLGPALGADGPRPDESQPVGVPRVDLVERAVAPAIERAAPVDPVRRVRIEQHGVGDRRHLAPLRLQRRFRLEDEAGGKGDGPRNGQGGELPGPAFHRRSFPARPATTRDPKGAGRRGRRRTADHNRWESLPWTGRCRGDAPADSRSGRQAASRRSTRAPPPRAITRVGRMNRMNAPDSTRPPTMLTTNGTRNIRSSLRSYSKGDRPREGWSRSSETPPGSRWRVAAADCRGYRR